MLNGGGNSVFDIYYDYISSTKSQQMAMLADEGFLDSVQPASILLEVTAEEVYSCESINTSSDGRLYSVSV